MGGGCPQGLETGLVLYFLACLFLCFPPDGTSSTQAAGGLIKAEEDWNLVQLCFQPERT